MLAVVPCKASGAQAAGADKGELDAPLTRGAETQAAAGAAVWSTGYKPIKYLFV